MENKEETEKKIDQHLYEFFKDIDNHQETTETSVEVVETKPNENVDRPEESQSDYYVRVRFEKTKREIDMIFITSLGFLMLIGLYVLSRLVGWLVC